MKLIVLTTFLIAIVSCAKNELIDACNIAQNRQYRVFTDSSFNSPQQGTIEFALSQYKQIFNSNTISGAYEKTNCTLIFNPASPMPSVYDIIPCASCDLYLKVRSGAISDKCLKF